MKTLEQKLQAAFERGFRKAAADVDTNAAAGPHPTDDYRSRQIADLRLLSSMFTRLNGPVDDPGSILSETNKLSDPSIGHNLVETIKGLSGPYPDYRQAFDTLRQALPHADDASLHSRLYPELLKRYPGTNLLSTELNGGKPVEIPGVTNDASMLAGVFSDWPTTNKTTDFSDLMRNLGVNPKPSNPYPITTKLSPLLKDRVKP